MLKRITSIFLIIILLVFCTSGSTFAKPQDTLDDIMGSAKDFLEDGNPQGTINEDALRDTSNSLYYILVTIAVAIAFAVGLVIGIQFITGSVEQQAKVKETLVPYVVGVFVVFASFTIWSIAVRVGNDVTDYKEIASTQETYAQENEQYNYLFKTKEELKQLSESKIASYYIELDNAIKTVQNNELKKKLINQWDYAYSIISGRKNPYN